MKLPILEVIERYIASKKLAWSPATIRSERHRLRGMSEAITGDPAGLWRYLEESKTKPYARVTAWSRVTSFWQWALERGYADAPNLYPIFRRDNARLFKNVYRRKIPKLTLAEAKDKISHIEDREIREAAKELLFAGLRVVDAQRREGDVVVGKGGKLRRVAVEESDAPTMVVGYRRLLRALAKQGLKPHDLRKIFATHLWRSGFDQVEMCRVMGWKKFDTAASYIDSDTEDQLMARIKKTIGE